MVTTAIPIALSRDNHTPPRAELMCFFMLETIFPPRFLEVDPPTPTLPRKGGGSYLKRPPPLRGRVGVGGIASGTPGTIPPSRHTLHLLILTNLPESAGGDRG